jgi:hypothetical protein
MLLEQYMTPVNIIIAVILVVLGYLAYKKYQKNNNSYEHANTVSAPSEFKYSLGLGMLHKYTFSEGYTQDVNIEPFTSKIITKFNEETLNFNNKYDLIKPDDLKFDLKFDLSFNFKSKEFRISGPPIIRSKNKKDSKDFIEYTESTKSISFTQKNNKIFINKTYDLKNIKVPKSMSNTGNKPNILTESKAIDITTEINGILLEIGRGEVEFDINIKNDNKKSYLSIIPKPPQILGIPYFDVVIDKLIINNRNNNLIEVQLYKNTMHTTTDQLQDTIRPYCSTCAICPQESKQE